MWRTHAGTAQGCRLSTTHSPTSGQEERDDEFSDVLHHTVAGSGPQSPQDKECPELPGERADSLQRGIKVPTWPSRARAAVCCVFTKARSEAQLSFHLSIVPQLQ